MNKRESTHWADAKERGHYWAMQTLVVLYRLAGRAVIKPIVCVVVFYFFASRRSTRRHSFAYLRRVLPHAPTMRDVWRHHLAFGLALVDRIGAWMGRIRRSDVAFDGHQTMVELQSRGSGAVLLGAHLGNLEMCRAVVENDGSLKLNVVLHNHNTENFNRIMRGVSGQSQVRLIQVTEITPATAIYLREKLDQGEFLILLADRLPPENVARTIRHPVLGDEAELPIGPFWLALMLGAPVYFIGGFATDSGYRAVLEPLYDGGGGRRVPRRERDAACRKLVATYVGWLEHYCRLYPYQWFNFYDFWGDDAVNRHVSKQQPSAPSSNNGARSSND